MRLTSSYGMKLKGDVKALEAAIELYRKALRMLIPIINDGWDLISECRYVNQKYNLIEKWIHNTRTNQARFNFDAQFPKFPTYLRRSAIAKALGIVSSYRSNLENWEREGKGQAPKLSLTHFAYPAYYKGIYLETLTLFIKLLNSKCSKMAIGFTKFINSKLLIVGIIKTI